MNEIEVARRRMNLINEVKVELLALCSPEEAKELEKIIRGILNRIQKERR